jgi:hypothetical protein
MEKKFDKFPIIFTHASRTGGGCLTLILNRQYKIDELFLFYVRSKGGTTREALDEFLSLSKEQKQTYKVLGGHFHFGLHRFYDKYTYITLFRNPVKRIVSLYSIALTVPEYYLHNIVIANRMSLKDFVGNGLSPELNNGQTRMISGVEQVPFGKCTREMLNLAKKNFDENYPIFGITERYDESVLLMKDFFGWCSPYYNTRNTSSQSLKRMEVSDDVIELIKEYNKLDIEFYQYACERFQSIIDKQDKSFHKELARFKKRNGYMQKWGNPKNKYLSFEILNIISEFRKRRSIHRGKK